MSRKNSRAARDFFRESEHSFSLSEQEPERRNPGELCQGRAFRQLPNECLNGKAACRLRKVGEQMKKMAVFVYGVGSYIAFLATFVYAVAFIGDFAVPKSLDGPTSPVFATALLIDCGLLALFAVQHSLMARPAFKRMITRVIPQSAERSTYVLASSLALAFLFWKWEPLGGTVWNVQLPAARVLLYGGYGFGWVIVLISTFLINHFDLFGLRQVWRELQGKHQAGLRFSTPLLYRLVRHPLYVGWLVVFWSTPVMTVSHLFFAVMTTAYILVAIRFEEADLMKVHPEYAGYRGTVPMLLPKFSPARLASAEVQFAERDTI
jgi:protein-S-isoprenylcysteine O-methyltransferase Ste14